MHRHPRAHDGDPFARGPTKQEIKRLSLQGGAVTLAGQFLSQGLSVVSVMILARLLFPADFGLVAMITALTGLANVASDLGLSMTTVRAPSITRAQMDKLFWMNAGLGATVAAIIASLSPVIARFYQKPELTAVSLALSSTFLIAGLGIQHSAVLTRNMQFSSIAAAKITGQFCGIIAAVVGALFGLRYWALVMQHVVGCLVTTVGFWLAAAWVPGMPARGTAVGPLIRFAANVTGFDVINYFSRNLDNILIGRFWGSAALGLYSRAYALLMLPIQNLRNPLNKVALPALSRLQADPGRYRAYYIRYSALLAFFSMPLVGALFITSESVITVVLGSRWIEVSPLFKLLAAAAFIQPVAGLRGIVLLSSGHGSRYFWWGVWNALTTSCAFLAGVPWGAKGVATAYVIQQYLVLYPSLWFVFRGTPVRIRDFFGSIRRPALASMLMVAAGFLFIRESGMRPGLASLISTGLICGPVYLGAWSLLSIGTGDLERYASYPRLLLARKPILD